MKWIITSLAIIVLGTFNLADRISDYNKKQEREVAEYKHYETKEIKRRQQEFKKYLALSKSEFDTWNAHQKKELRDFKEEIKRNWGSFIEPSNKKWVEYSKDRSSVSAVDFEKGRATVSVLVDANASKEHIKEQIVKAVTRTITSKGSNTGKPVEVDESEQHLPKPILSEQVQDEQGQMITVNGVSQFAIGLIEDSKITSIHTIPKVPGREKDSRIKVQVSFNLATDHLQKRVARYMPYIQKYCSKYRLNKARVLATIHTESHFNPMAISSANAIGLMQLVPLYGAREAYQYVYGEGAIPKAQFLYDPERNIELGCAYIYLLQNRYFSSVNDTNSMRYCTIAAYNTGPKNVAYAFATERSVDKSIDIINNMKNAQQVYNHLILRLPYAETRHYLAMVTERMSLYQ